MPDKSSVTLSIGGLYFDLACRPPALADALRRRFAAFLSNSPPDARLTLDLQPAEAAPDISNLPLIWKDDGVSFSALQGTGHLALDGRSGLLTGQFTALPETAEYFLRLAVALLAFRRGGLLFHAAGVRYRGAGLAFFGPSGAGKTTLAENAPAGSVLNDDLVLLFPQEGGWQMHATPFWNPTQVQPANTCVPLKALFRLAQSHQNWLDPLTPALALAEVLACIPVLPANPHLSAALFARTEKLLSTVPAFVLRLRADPSFWPVVDRFLSA